ncbi:MAG: TonB-dependent receptor, partial [Acidobacteria bacterium]
MRASSVAIVIGFVLLAAPVAGQTTTASVIGTVTDAQKGVLPGATVTALNVENGAQATGVTDATGAYRIPALRPGLYDVNVEMQGFASRSRKGIQLFVGTEAKIDFELGLAGVEESVTVTGEAPLIEVTKSEVSSVIDRKQIDALPLSGRSFTDLMRLTPGVDPSGRIGGMYETASNSYLVDGVSNDRAWTGGNRTSYSAETIREFRVITEQFAAEYGQASGGVVNVVSRSGTNNFENRV